MTSMVAKEHVSFWIPKEGGPQFTPLYLSEDDGGGSFASLNAGDFKLYVGGGGINLPFKQALDKAGHQTKPHYEKMHRTLYDAAAEIGKGTRKLTSWEDAGLDRGNLPRGVESCSVLLSSLPSRFIKEGTNAGTVFIVQFTPGMEPNQNPSNIAMIYAIGPEGPQAKSVEDFLDAVEATGKGIIDAVTMHNRAAGSDSVSSVFRRISTLRVCLISGAKYLHKKATKSQVASTILRGVSAGYVPGHSPSLNFAYDHESGATESVFQEAYVTEGGDPEREL